MTTSQDDFSPTSIDQAIDRPGDLLSRDDAQLIHDVRAMFEQEKQASIERGWARIASQRAQNAHNDQPSEVLDLSTYRQRNEWISLVQDNTLPSSPKKDMPKKKGRLRWLSMVAAVLMCVALVSSLTLVLGTIRNNNVSGRNHKNALHHTPTPSVNPATCNDDPANPVEERLCADGKEMALNITKNFQVHLHDSYGNVTGTTMLNVTFLRAYADVSQLLLVYKINQGPVATQTSASNWGGFLTLITDQGQLDSHEDMMTGFLAQQYDTSGLPTNVTQLRVQAIQTTFGESLPLDFTLPISATRQVVTVGKTVTRNEYTLTLDYLTLTESATTLTCSDVFPSPSSPAGTPPNIEIQSLMINGKPQGILPGGETGKESPGIRSGSGTETITLNQVLLNQPGTWTITLVLTDSQSSKTLLTAKFTFTVPASA